MTVYYVDDGGSATSPYDTWAKAATSLSALDDAVALASGDIVYIGHDHVCQYTHSAERTITGPTSGAPCLVISATQGSSPPTYQASTSNQVDTSEGAYKLFFDGSFALYGICINSGADIEFASDSNEAGYAFGCTFKPAAGKTVIFGMTYGRVLARKCTIDATNDSGDTTETLVRVGAYAHCELNECTFSNCENRTSKLIFGLGRLIASGCDFQSATNANTPYIFLGGCSAEFANCITADTWLPYSLFYPGGEAVFTNCGPASAPTYICKGAYVGTLTAVTTVTRTNGGQVSGTACSWQVAASANANEGAPFLTPWLYATLDSTGSKTFTVHIANNTVDLTDAQAWLEVEYLGTSGEANTTLGLDARSITTTAAAQTDDTSSSWSGATLTYLQSLAVTATVNVTGLYRARVAIAGASTIVYVDPLVIVS